MINNKISLDTTLLKFSHEKQDSWKVRDAVRGTQIFGGIGSGKSSGSGKTIAKAFLKNGFGGVILCAKPDETANWEQMAKEAGREDDLIIFREDSGLEYNPLQYEMTRGGKGAGEIFNLTNLFMEIYKMGNRLSGGGSSNESERYWDNALRRCINSLLLLLKLSKETVSIQNMQRLLSSAPLKEEVEAGFKLKNQKFIDWTQSSYCLKCLFKAENLVENDSDDEYVQLLSDYFLKELASMPDRVRPIIVESFLGLAEPFSYGILKECFSKGISPMLKPEVTHSGKIIILDFPVKEYLQAGVYAQGIYKFLWQQATERRDPNQDLLPVFLWVDEHQLFLSDYDQIFQTTARSSRACTVYISQNISNYYVAVGGKNPIARVDSLLGNLGTKIFHSNNDAVTNEWAARTIGKTFIEVKSISLGKESSASSSQQLHFQVEPREFTILKSGGDENQFLVEGILTVAGREWSNKKNYLNTIFNQK